MTHHAATTAAGNVVATTIFGATMAVPEGWLSLGGKLAFAVTAAILSRIAFDLTGKVTEWLKWQWARWRQGPFRSRPPPPMPPPPSSSG
jgi:hypothetical protein